MDVQDGENVKPWKVGIELWCNDTNSVHLLSRDAKLPAGSNKIQKLVLTENGLCCFRKGKLDNKRSYSFNPNQCSRIFFDAIASQDSVLFVSHNC